MRNKYLLKKFHGKPCLICRSTTGTVGHHLLTVGAHPNLTNQLLNIIPVCHPHHMHFHDFGLTNAVIVFNLRETMLERGFLFNDYSKKWFRPIQIDKSNRST